MSLYLGVHHFDGELADLLAAYDRLLQSLPLENLDLHVCVVRDGGLSVFDACPSKAVHDEFVRSTDFLGAIAAAGLPDPRTQGLGDVHLAHMRQAVRP